jgi:NitT/TauT family transport system substrate-binding protein
LADSNKLRIRASDINYHWYNNTNEANHYGEKGDDSMKKLKKLSLIIAGVIATMGILSGCQTDKGENTPVRIAFFPNITHSQALINKDEKRFEKLLGGSRTVEWKAFNAGPGEIEALFAGEVDLGYIGPGPAINGYVKSKGDLQIIAGATNAGAIFVSRKGLEIKDIKELDGKKIAVPQYGNTQDLTLRSLLSDSGLKDAAKGGTVQIVQAENPDIKTLLDNGQVDAALVPEPWGSRLIKESGANIILDYDEILNSGNYASTVVIGRKDFIDKNPDVVEKFLKSHVEITSYIKNDPDAAAASVNRQIAELTQKPLSEDILKSAFKRIKSTNDPEKTSVYRFAELAVAEGFLKELPNLDGLFNLEILDKVVGASSGSK